MKIGLSVQCRVCGRSKAPRGRSAPIGSNYCTRAGCKGYDQEPRVGDLWPGETEEAFGYPVSADGTAEVSTRGDSRAARDESQPDRYWEDGLAE